MMISFINFVHKYIHKSEKMKVNFDKVIKEAILETFPQKKKASQSAQNLKEQIECKDEKIQESYVVGTKKFELQTEKLSTESKQNHQDLMNAYISALNEVSAKLDTANRDVEGSTSEFRALKLDETYNLNAAFLHGLYFDNISDIRSSISKDQITFMRLERDFGTFDAWQKDFIACCISARNGWACTVYNSFLKRYMNVVIDLHSNHVPFAAYPIIVMDCWEHSYTQDFGKDKKAYVFEMMKELNWQKIEERIKRIEGSEK